MAEPTTAHLFTGRVSATPIASTYCLACMHVLDKAAREQSLHSVLGRREVFNTWNKLISLKCSRLPCNKFGQAATSLIWQAMFCDVLWVPVRYLSTQPPTSVPWYVCMSSSAAPRASGQNLNWYIGHVYKKLSYHMALTQLHRGSQRARRCGCRPAIGNIYRSRGLYLAREMAGQTTFLYRLATLRVSFSESFSQPGIIRHFATVRSIA